MTNWHLRSYADIQRHPAAVVSQFDQELTKTVQSLYEAMTLLEAFCLAAPQVGMDLSIFVLASSAVNSQKQCFINPKIIHQTGETCFLADSLEYPGVEFSIKRPKVIELSYLDTEGQEQTMTAQDGLASLIAYQIDTLNGILVTDRMSKLKRDRFMSKVKKMHHHACGTHCGHEH